MLFKREREPEQQIGTPKDIENAMTAVRNAVAHGFDVSPSINPEALSGFMEAVESDLAQQHSQAISKKRSSRWAVAGGVGALFLILTGRAVYDNFFSADAQVRQQQEQSRLIDAEKARVVALETNYVLGVNPTTPSIDGYTIQYVPPDTEKDLTQLPTNRLPSSAIPSFSSNSELFFGNYPYVNTGIYASPVTRSDKSLGIELDVEVSSGINKPWLLPTTNVSQPYGIVDVKNTQTGNERFIKIVRNLTARTSFSALLLTKQ